MTIVEAAEVRQRLTMPVCIDLMRTSLRELEAGNYTQPLRSIALLPGGEKFGFMPACLGDCFGAKVLSAFPQNAGTKYPSHIGYVLLFEGEHGSFLGMADAAVITEIRTGAVSGVATDLLARPDAHRLAIIDVYKRQGQGGLSEHGGTSAGANARLLCAEGLLLPGYQALWRGRAG